MAVFEIIAPNGKKYRVEGSSAEGAARAVQQMLSEESPAPNPASAPSRSPRPTPRPPEQEMERAAMRANALPPGADPRAVPQAAPPLDPSSMPGLQFDGQLPEGTEVIAMTENGGRVMRAADGSLSYADDVMATSNQQDVMRILRGAEAGDVATRRGNTTIVDQNPVASRVATAVTGVPLVGSYGDEIARMAGGQDAQDAYLASVDAVGNAYPGQAMALRGAGTVGGAGVAARAAGPIVSRAETAGARFLRNSGLGMVGGAVEGTVYGAGEQQGAGRVQNAVVQGAIGGALGFGAGAIAAGIENHVMRQADRYRAQTVKTIQEELGVSPAAARMVRDALDGGDIERAVRTLRDAGPDAMLAEASPGLRILLNTQTKTDIGAANVAGRALDATNTARYGRLTSTMDDVLGNPQGREFVEESIMESSRAARRQAYGDAFDTPINYASPEGQELEEILRTRMPRGVVEGANEALREAGESAQILARVADDGTITYEGIPSVLQIDHMVRRLQDMEGAAVRAGRTGDAIRYGNLRRDIRSRLRKMVPDYGKALDEGADAIAKREALELGTQALKMRRSTLRMNLRGASEAERRFVSQGIREEIDDLMARAGAIASDPNTTEREIRRVLEPLTSRQGKDNLIEVLGAQQAKRVFDVVEEARSGLELRAAVSRNSDTAISRNVNERADELVAETFLEAVAGVRPAQAKDHIIHALAGNSAEAVQLRRSGLAQEITTLLTGKRGAGAAKALDIVRGQIGAEDALSPGDARLVALALTRLGLLSAYQQGRLALSP